MSSIRILPDRVANQIAAGEVIERPVAVVKELVENSIDAGASRIEIEFRNGGKSLIRISDNGRGMPPDEAQLALERHATSKIREAADLNDIMSFGFRGEALPSIASVSRFTLRTRTEAWEHGTEILINGGKLLHKKECGMPVGTVIEVAHLFNSVPARRKFLKTDPTETAHITYTTRLFAVAHPNIAFRVIDNGRTVFQSPACEDLKERVAEIWGRSFADDLMPVDSKDSETGYRLTGLTAKPGVGRSTRRELITLINKRPVDSRTLGFAVLDAYIGRIQKGRYPPAFLFLEIPPQEVDVNVHPAKREVRFRNDGAVRRFVLSSISDALTATAQKMPPLAKESIPSKASEVQTKTNPPQITTPIRPRNEPSSKQIEAKTQSTVIERAPEFQQSQEPQKSPGQKPPQTDWKFLNLVQGRYALFETARGLFMLHLRHADQRVRFERILRQFNKEIPGSQSLLIPIPIELEPLATETLENALDLLNGNGFEIEAFGRNFYRIMALPEWLPQESAEVFIRDLVDRLRLRGGDYKDSKLAWEAIARLAIEKSYRDLDAMNEETARSLANDLMQCTVPHTSPSGKPTYLETTWSDWERRFGI